jgi:hypothetical protein
MAGHRNERNRSICRVERSDPLSDRFVNSRSHLQRTPDRTTARPLYDLDIYPGAPRSSQEQRTDRIAVALQFAPHLGQGHAQKKIKRWFCRARTRASFNKSVAAEGFEILTVRRFRVPMLALPKSTM